MVERRANTEEVVEFAIKLSRKAFAQSVKFERAIDRLLGSANFRKTSIDVLIDKERTVQAIKDRLDRGGITRSGDRNLFAVLERQQRELRQLERQFPWQSFKESDRSLIESYMKERRNHLQLGDPERVRNSYTQAFNTQKIAC